MAVKRKCLCVLLKSRRLPKNKKNKKNKKERQVSLPGTIRMARMAAAHTAKFAARTRRRPNSITMGAKTVYAGTSNALLNSMYRNGSWLGKNKISAKLVYM